MQRPQRHGLSITHITWPEELSNAVRLAARDLHEALETKHPVPYASGAPKPKYWYSALAWHHPPMRQVLGGLHSCSVCLGGAVIAGEFPDRYHEDFTPYNFRPDDERRLGAMNCVREAALEMVFGRGTSLAREDLDYHEPLEGIYLLHEINYPPARFRKAADVLSEAGL